MNQEEMAIICNMIEMFVEQIENVIVFLKGVSEQLLLHKWYIIGYLYAVCVGGICVRLFVDQTHEIISTISRKIEGYVDPLYKEYYDWQTFILGFIEISLYTAATNLGKLEWIAVWLGLKTAAGWTRWNKKGGLSEIPGRAYFLNFLLGNGLTILYGVLGGYVPKLAQNNKEVLAILSMVALFTGSLLLILWLAFHVRERVEHLLDDSGN